MADVRRILRPDFFRPNRKPVGPVEIDRAHPLGAVADFVYLGGDGAVSEHSLDTYGSPTHAIFAGEEALRTGTSVVMGANSKRTKNSYDPRTTSITVFVKARSLIVPYYGRIASTKTIWGSADGFEIAAGPTDSSVYISGDHSSGTEWGPTVSWLAWSDQYYHNLCVEFDGAVNVAKLWVDGRYVGSKANVFISSAQNQLSLGTDADGNEYQFPGDISAVYIFRGVVGEYASQLHSNQYAFLRPANDRIWVPVSGGGGVTGSSTSSSQNAAIAAAGTIEVQATGTPASQNAATVSSGAVEVQAASVSTTQNAATVASGTVGNAVTGSSISASQNAATVASGTVEATATATPSSQNAATTASGTVEVTATSTASSQNAATVATGTAQNGSTGTVIASSQNAAVTAAGTVEVTVVAVATSMNCSQTVASGTSDAPVPSSGSGGPEPLMGDEWDFLRDAATPKRRKTSKRLEKKKAKKAAQKPVAVQQQLVTSPQADAPVEQTLAHEIPAEIKQAVDQARDINKAATVEGIEAARQKRIAKRRREEEMLMVALLEVI